MSYGFNLVNNSGSVLIDDTLPQIHLVTEGATSAATGSEETYSGLVTFPRAITNPIVFVRAGVGTIFRIGSITESNFEYVSSGVMDYRVYEGAALSVTPGDYGLAVFNSAGVPIFDSNKSLAAIYQISDALLATDPFPTALSSYSIRTINFSLTASDSGLPFVNAALFTCCFLLAGSAWMSAHSVAGNFLSASALEIRAEYLGGFGSNPSSGVWYRTGQYPRSAYFIR